MKTCNKCNETKPREDFYSRAGSRDGVRNDCKECLKARIRRNRDENLDRYRAYDRARDQNPERKIQKVKSMGPAVQKYAALNPEKVKAHRELRNAIRRKEIVRLPCEVCGKENTHGHHSSYSLPLVVTWLCKPHHDQLHRDFSENERRNKHEQS